MDDPTETPLGPLAQEAMNGLRAVVQEPSVLVEREPRVIIAAALRRADMANRQEQANRNGKGPILMAHFFALDPPWQQPYLEKADVVLAALKEAGFAV